MSAGFETQQGSPAEGSRFALGMVGLGAAPAALAVLIAHSDLAAKIASGEGPVACPFREVTGLPCPFCGATRSFVLFANLDGAGWHFNPVWPAVALLLVVAGAAAISIGRSRRPITEWVRRRMVALTAVAIAIGWATSLINIGPVGS